MAVPCAPTGDKQVQLRRGTTAENNAFTGADGELSFDTDQNRLRVHDGVTPGGFLIALFSDIVAGSSPPFVDSTNLIMGSGDNTKLLRFEVDGFTAGTTRVLTPQNASYILAGIDIINNFSQTQLFHEDQGIHIGTMFLSDPGAAGQLVIDNGSVSIPGGLSVGAANEIILAADGAASFATGVSFFTNTGQLFVGGDTTIVPDGSAYFGVGQVLQIGTDGSVLLNSNIVLNANGSAAFGTSGITTIDASGNIALNGNALELMTDGSASFAAGAVSISDVGLLTAPEIIVGNLTQTLGAQFQVTGGADQRAGEATLVAGEVEVLCSSVSANTIVMLTRKTSGGTPGTLITYTVSAGTSFTINSDSALDTSTFSYFLIEVM